MSNELTHMTQFQQKAQLRLQEMEVEWRKTLFERFRIICREEMMDVMKALLSTMPSGTEEMERKLAEWEERTSSNQMELFTTVSQTSEEVRNLAKKLETQPTGTDPQLIETLTKGQENISKQVTTQEEVARQLQEDMRTSAQLSRSTLWKAVGITAAVVLLACGAAVYSLKLLGGSTILSQADLRKHEKLMQENAAMTAESKTLMVNKETLSKELQDLAARREAIQAEIRQSSETQRTVTANLESLQQQITRLQLIQEQFRFKLVKGESGGVFVEVPTDAQPFQYQDRLYIQIK